MRVVSVINYKGGVGKTTLAANLGVGLAQVGKRVLLLDLDPQTNLTLSFYSVIDWQGQLAQGLTIKRWFDGHVSDTNDPPKLSELSVKPAAVAQLIEPAGGKLDLIASHLKLVDVDIQLSRELFRGDPAHARSRRVRLYRILADALEDDALSEYDYVIIDCAPDFGLVTQTALVASDWLLVPSKADHLSTLSISYFTESVKTFVHNYNDISKAVAPIAPRFLGAVFTMVQLYGGKPIALQRSVIGDVEAEIGVPVFRSQIRNSPREAIESTRAGIPTILRGGTDRDLTAEYTALRDEFLDRIER